jgi:7-cyano-7-deazaguanine synthase
MESSVEKTPDLTQHAIVVMSGGQDSVTCLGVALNECGTVEAVTFRYGQKHAVEVSAARDICIKHNIPYRVIDLSPILQNMQSSALVNGGDVNQEHKLLAGLPASFVPARNALFLTAAYGLALEAGATRIYTGVCQTDYSGYPDCREDFIRALNFALDVGYQSKIEIRTPLMHLDKAATFQLAWSMGCLETIIEETMTCYNGDTTRNEWGKGCGECPACQLRAKGWDEYKAKYQHAEPTEA